MSDTPSPFIVDIRPARRSVVLRSWRGVLFPLGLAGFDVHPAAIAWRLDEVAPALDEACRVV